MATVLIVDDDVTSISILVRQLKSEFNVVFATSGRQAMELIPQVRPDLILLDVIMPDMDGYALCASLKADPETSAIPIIFITGLHESEAESRGLDLGAADYLTKPFFNTNVVRARVRNNVELKRARDRLLALSVTDGLTGLFNRRAFDVALERERKRLTRMHSPIALLMIDVDFFKPFNDVYGHVAGDDCLREISGAIAGAMQRPGDFAARYGGEEFVCILPESTVDGAVVIGERIQTTIRTRGIPHTGSSVASFVTVSIGIVSAMCVQGLNDEALLRSADACLYNAKAEGRNRIVARDTLVE